MIDFVLISLDFFNARNLKNRAPVEARAQFFIFRMFDVRSKSASKTAPKKHGFRGRKSGKIMKKSVSKEMFFSTSKFYRFFLVWVLFWEGFGRVLGRVQGAFCLPKRVPKGQNTFFQ